MRKTTQKTYHYFTDAVFALTILLIARVAPAQNLLYVGVSRAGSIDVITPAGVIQTNFITGLSLPTALAFNSVGNLFVADANSGAIYEFTNYNGTLKTNINFFASGLSSPYGLAFDSAGDLFEADLGSHTVNEFTNQNGILNATRGAFASIPGSSPAGLAFDNKGDLFEADYSGGKVNEFTNQNGTLNSAPGAFASGLESDGPDGLAFDTAGNLFVSIAASAGMIIKITPNGTQSTFATYVTTLGLSNPLGVAFNSSGNLFVANEQASQSFGNIIQYVPDGGTNFFANGIPAPTCVAFAPSIGLQMVATNQPMYLNVSEPSPYYDTYTTIIQASSNLMFWADVYTNVPPFNFVDPSAPQMKSRFYRAHLVP